MPPRAAAACRRSTRMLAQSTKIEMDLRLEAAALSELGENTTEDPRVPRPPLGDWGSRHRPRRSSPWKDRRHQECPISRPCAHAVPRSQCIERDGHPVLPAPHAARRFSSHADMHPGNLFVKADGTIVAVDLGHRRTARKKDGGSLPKSSYGSIRRDLRPRRGSAFSRPAMCLPIHDVHVLRAGDPLRSASPFTASRREPNLDGQAAGAAVRGDQDLRHAGAA